MAPAQQGQQHHHDNGKDACALTMATTPLWQGRWHQLEDGNNNITTRAAMLLQQLQRCLGLKDNCKSTTGTSLWQGQWCQLDDSKNACALMPATTPMLQGEQCQLIDYARLTTAEMPLQQGLQLQSRQWQKRLCINSNSAFSTRAATPLWWEQGCLCIDDDNNVQQGWWCHLKDSNNAIATRATMPSQIKSNNTTITRAMTPAQQQQGCLGINNGNNAIVMRATIAIVMMAKKPVHWQRWCHHN